MVPSLALLASNGIARMQGMGKLTDGLRTAIEMSDKNRSAIAREAGIEASVLSRFMTGSSIALDTADKIAEVLGTGVLLPRAVVPRGTSRWICPVPKCNQKNEPTDIRCTRCQGMRQ